MARRIFISGGAAMDLATKKGVPADGGFINGFDSVGQSIGVKPPSWADKRRRGEI